jgi:chitodextrinase/lysophospholipase L1-like esterase
MTLFVARAQRAFAGFVGLWGIVLVPILLSGAGSASFLAIGEIVQAREPAADAPAAGPFVSLPLNDATGTIAGDASGNGNNGTLLNGPTWTTGQSGGALSFDGTDDTLYIANSSTLNSATTGITVTAWVYRSANQAGGASVISRQLGTTFYEHYYLGFEDGKYRWFVNTTSGYSDTTLGGQAPLGQWVHVVGTYDGTDVKLYANGVLQFSSPHSGTLSADITGITIGATHNDAAHTPVEVFNGKIDEVNIYGQALTAAEVLQVYQADASPASSGAFGNIAIMPLGDSLTYGFINDGNSDNEIGGYRRYLWERLRGDGITNVDFVGSLANGIPTIDRDHEGHGGWRIDDLEAAVGGWLNASQPDIVLLLAGANDIIQGYGPSLALSRMGLLLDKIHTFRPAAKVIVANLPGGRANADSMFSNVTPAAVSAFNGGLPSLVNARAGQGWNIVLIDAFGSAGLDRSAASPDYSIDGMHLSLAGYSKLASLWYSALNLGAADAAAPSVPNGLTGVGVSASQINLSWGASTDDVGVTGYQVFRNGVALATTASTMYQDTGLAPSTTYSYTVLAYDAANNQSAQSAAALAATLSAPRITALSWNAAFPAAWNVPITFTAIGTGGAALEFKFLSYSTATGWVVRQDYSSANTFTWFPPQGANAVQVWVRAAGSTAAYQDWAGTDVFSVISASVKLTGIVSNVPFPASPATTQTWTAFASGGIGALEYKFLHYDLAANAWTVLRDWSTNNQASWTPGTANSGWHSLQVWVRTVGSSAAWEDWRATDSFLVSAAGALALSQSRSLAGMRVGDLVTWTATAVGGTGPWEYEFIAFDGTTWKVMQGYSAQNTFSWFPPAQTCALQVWIRAAGSHAYWELYQSTGYFVVNP